MGGRRGPTHPEWAGCGVAILARSCGVCGGVSQFGWSPLGLELGGRGRLGPTEQVFQRSWKRSLITGIKDLDTSGVARLWDLTFHFKFLLRRNFKGK